MTTAPYYLHNEFVDSIEVSVRVRNALRRKKVDSLEKFMKLTRAETKRWDNFGDKSWREVQEVQAGILHQHPDLLDPWPHFQELVAGLNEFMERYPEYRTLDAGRGFLVAVRTNQADAVSRVLA